RLRKRVLADAPVSEKWEAILQSHRHGPVVRVHEAEQSTARNQLIFGEELAIVAWTQLRENALRVSQHTSDSLARRKSDDRVVADAPGQRIGAQPLQTRGRLQALEDTAVAWAAGA